MIGLGVYLGVCACIGLGFYVGSIVLLFAPLALFVGWQLS